MLWIIGIFVFGLVLGVSFWIAGLMQVSIGEVFRLRKLECSIRKGEVSLMSNDDSHVSSDDLMRLQRAKFTVVGVGGVGPAYLPSFDIRCICQAELERRRKKAS